MLLVLVQLHTNTCATIELLQFDQISILLLQQIDTTEVDVYLWAHIVYVLDDT